MRIAFLDFEFGQIYGSWRRDFLITEVAVLIYDTNTNCIHLGEKLFKPLCEVIVRKRVEKENGFKTCEYFICDESKNIEFDPNYKKTKKDRWKVRAQWNRAYERKLRKFLYDITSNIDDIVVFGGSEDINLLKRHYIHILASFHDLQSFMHRDYGKLYSLDLVAKTLDLKVCHKNTIASINHSYSLPKKNKNYYQYNQKHLKAHHALGDCVLLFLAYKELYDF